MPEIEEDDITIIMQDLSEIKERPKNLEEKLKAIESTVDDIKRNMP